MVQLFEIFFELTLILLLIWSSYKTIFKKDRAVGLVLYLALVIIADSFYVTGVFIPGLPMGSIKYSEICALFLILSNPPSNLSEKNNSMILILFSAYFLLLFLSALSVDYGPLFFRIYIFPQLVAFLVAFRGFDGKEDYQRFLLYFMALLIIIGLFVFFDRFFDHWLLTSHLLYNYEYENLREVGRFGSFFINPNYMGAFVVLVFPVVFIRALLEKNNLKRIYCWMGVLAIVFALIETHSRGPLLAFLVSVFFFIFIRTRGYSLFKKISALALLISVFYLIVPDFFGHSTQRFETLEGEMFGESYRRTTWAITTEIIADHPFLGIGLEEGQFQRYMKSYGYTNKYGKQPLANPHNSYLQIAVFAGIPALVIFILLNVLLIKSGIATVLRNSKQEFSLHLMGFTAGMLGFLAVIFVGMFMFTRNVAPAYWVIFGLVFSIVNSESKLKARTIT
jgi:O-antigen ligase